MNQGIKILLFGLGRQIGIVAFGLWLFARHERKIKKEEGEENEGTANNEL